MRGGRPEVTPAELRALEERVPSDEVFALLSDSYVRYVCYYLHAEPATTLDQLAAVIAGLEATESETMATRADHERIRIRLSHAVLPRLEDSGYLDFDRDERTITRGSVPPEFYELLGVASDSRVE